MIKINHLTYTYPNQPTPALQDISWRVGAGEFVLLTGPSGSGKSTLLRCLNGLVPHFSGGKLAGQVAVAGVDVVAAGPRALSHQVGFVMQSPEAQAVLDEVTGEIVFGMEQAAVAPAEMARRLGEVLALLGLEGLKERPLLTLSGGERQRVAIAAALALRPKLLLLDEPTSQLDPEAADELVAGLVRLRRELGLTIILAEHRLARLLPEVDRVTYMEAGRIVDDGRRMTDDGRRTTDDGQQKGVGGRWSVVSDNGRRTTDDEPEKVVGGLSSVVGSPVLAVQKLVIRYGQAEAVRGVDLTVGRGEVVALVGANGSGKSSLLKGVVGLLPLAGGEVWINGRSTQNRAVAELCREVGYLPQNPDDLLFAESVEEELLVTLRNHAVEEQVGGWRRIAYSVWRKKNGDTAYAMRNTPYVGELLAQLGLTAVSQSYPRDLSVGQRQRVALGAVTVTQPGLLLLDEPTRGLDDAAKEALVGIWRGWQAAGMGILLVTHDVELVAAVADRVVILAAGKVVDEGEKTAVFSRNPHFAPKPTAQLFPGTGWMTVNDVD